MSKYLTYDEMSIETIRATINPGELIAYACALTQKKDVNSDVGIPELRVRKLIKYLVEANHTSPLEHASITVLIQGVSRSLLAQLTRHRMGSFTSASQHYTTYDKFPNVISADLIGSLILDVTVKQCDSAYKHFIAQGIPKEEARQVLPNAKAVNILWTVNARSLINFFNQRLCRRNVEEMYAFAIKMRAVCQLWFPDLFDNCVGPDCYTLGGCRQGHMKTRECVEADVPNFKR